MAKHWFIKISVSIILLICLSCDSVHGSSSPIVTIKNGTLEGIIMKSRNGREFLTFRGIPYAQPPIGELRFKPPKPFDAWTGVRSAKEDGNICTQRDVIVHQVDVVGVEDCLHLNVFTPKLPSKDIKACLTSYPVMIWIHGGGFLAGSGHTDFYAPQFLLDHDIVLVSFNYRLGPLGFLSTEDLVLPGNIGLKDQVQALRWVQENIAAFGGDPNRVTIFGESAGGASVQYHVISPLSRGLFQRAISQSGTAISSWAISPKPGHAKNQAKKLGKLLNCPTEKSEEFVHCLRQKNPVDIISTDYAFQVFDYCPIIPFRPVVEPDHPGAFIIQEPSEAIESGNVADVPWMTGFSTEEGAIKVSAIFGIKDKAYDELLDENFMELAPISLLYEPTCPEKLRDNVTKSIRDFYFSEKKIDFSMRKELVDMYTDCFFLLPANNAIKNHLENLGSPVYYYLFAYRGTHSLSTSMGDSETDYGVCHGDDLQYLFSSLKMFPEKKIVDEDWNMVDLMTKLFVNFATTGNPTPEINQQMPVKWKPVQTTKLEYLHIGNSKNLFMSDNLFHERATFWEGLQLKEKSLQHESAKRDEL